jgi:hypothetical protein
MLMVDQEEYIKYKTQQQLAKYLQQEQAVNQPSKNTRTNSGGPSADSANAAALKAAKEATKKAQEREERALRKVEELEKRLRKGVEERLTLERKNMEHEKRLKQMQEALDDAMGRWKQSTTLAVSSINELKNTVVRLKDDVRELITYAVALEKGDTNGVPRPSQIKVPFVGRIETHPNIPAMQSQMAPQQQHYQQQQQFLYPPHPMPEHQQYHSPAQQRGHVGTVSSPQATYQQYAPVHQQPQHFAPVHQQPQQEQPQQQQPQQQAPVPFFSPSPRKAQMSPPIVTNSSPANTTVPPASDLSNGRTQTAPADTRNGDLSSHPIV